MWTRQHAERRRGARGISLASGEFDGTRGWTDFSEMPTQTSDPTPPPGLSLIFSGGGAATITYVVADDMTEGRYIEITTTTDGRRLPHALDFLGADNLEGEILARMQYGPSNIAANDSAMLIMNCQDGSPDTRRSRCMRRLSGVSDEFRVDTTNPQSTLDTEGTFDPAGAWFWMRFRVDDGADIRMRAKAWTGALGDEPAGWTLDGTEIGLSAVTGEIGVELESGAAGGANMRCSFFSFSNDPDVFPPITPDDL